MLHEDSKGTPVKTINNSIFPKGILGKVIGCQCIPGTSERVYLIQTDAKIPEMVEGPKAAWYLDRDLINIQG